MKRQRTRLSVAQDIALENRGFDYIVDIHDGADYVQVIGSIGGGYEPFRVYNRDIELELGEAV